MSELTQIDRRDRVNTEGIVLQSNVCTLLCVSIANANDSLRLLVKAMAPSLHESHRRDPLNLIT